MQLEDVVDRELHRAASLAGRPGIAIPSIDLANTQAGSRASNQKAISRLVRLRRVSPVRKDLLVLPDATGRITTTLPDLIDAVTPTPYLITGGRALQQAELTDQYFLVAIVLVPSRVSKFSFRGETARFLLAKPDRIWGWERKSGPRFASPERTLVDAFSHTRYGVSFSQAITALDRAGRRDGRFLVRLWRVVRRFDEDATARRIGYVVDRLFGADAAEPFRSLIGERRAPVRLRTTGRDQGPVDPLWRVIVNASTTPEPQGSQ